MDQQGYVDMLSLLRYEVCGGAPLADEKSIRGSENLKKLYEASKKHDISHLVGDALIKQNLLKAGDEGYAPFQRAKFFAVCRYEQQNYELNSLSNALEQARISFVPLKGSVIRSFYPEAWMRTGCDIDVLVREQDLDRAVQVLSEQLGYRVEGKNSHDISLHTPGGVHIELHYNLIEKTMANSAGAVLKEVWHYTSPKESDSFHSVMSDEMFYFYHIAHMAKHFEHGGCGIRSFLDLWFMEKKVAYDMKACDALLERGGLLLFAEASRRLSRVWFEYADHDEVTQQMEGYILHGGMYGTKDNMVVVQQEKKGGKWKYIRSRVFLSRDQLKYKYPVLEKHPWMLPLIQVRRWCRIIFRGGFKSSAKELTLSVQVTENRKSDIRVLMDHLGL